MSDSSLGIKAFKGASWLALFKLISQIFSWIITIIVARILVPGDYGLMAMACIVTGYAEMFRELGLGSAIIQKPKPTQNELSSVFWFSFLFAGLLAISCFPIAQLTSYIFNNPRVIPLTQAVSVVFLMSGLSIVPYNLLRKDLDFKTVGIIEMNTTIISCVSMIIIAKLGGGVWTLMGGYITRAFSHVFLIYYKVRWFPRLHFNLKEAKSYLKFGVTMSIGRSLFYIWEQSDKFFAGRTWNANILGYYTFALELAQLPTEKIVVLINQVSFSALSKLQSDKEGFNNFYLNTTKITATLVFPLFVGGFLVGGDIVKILLNEKWYPIIFVFKYLCLSQIMMALNAVNNFAHAAQGRPHWGLSFHIAGVILMPISFYFSVQHGLNAILIPWFTTFFFMCIVWIIITLKKIDINLVIYFKNLSNPLMATVFLTIGVLSINFLINLSFMKDLNLLILVTTKILVGGLLYISFLWLFDRKIIYDLKSLRKA